MTRAIVDRFANVVELPTFYNLRKMQESEFACKENKSLPLHALLLLKGIGGALAMHFDGHWWGIGGHWQQFGSIGAQRLQNAGFAKPLIFDNKKHKYRRRALCGRSQTEKCKIGS